MADMVETEVQMGGCNGRTLGRYVGGNIVDCLCDFKLGGHKWKALCGRNPICTLIPPKVGERF